MSSHLNHIPCSVSQHLFQDFLSTPLEEFDSSRRKYVAVEAARELVKSLANDENVLNNKDLQPVDSSSVDEHFLKSSKAFVEEIFAIQSEMSKNEILQEKFLLLNEESIQSKPCIANISDLQAEIEQTELLLRQMKEKSKGIDEKVKEKEATRSRAQDELNAAKERKHWQVSLCVDSVACIESVSDNLTESALDAARIPSNDSKQKLEKLKSQKVNVEALLTGVESLLNVKLINVEVTPANGVLLTTAINGTHTFSYELDEMKKLVDIRLESTSSTHSSLETDIDVIDPLQLLCACASLPPPQDLRHALITTSAALRREESLVNDLKMSSIRKLCLLQRDRKNPCKIVVTCGGEISVCLRIHECYPNVPNGVHIESLSGTGGWSEEELNSARRSINSQCWRTVPEMVFKIISTFDS